MKISQIIETIEAEQDMAALLTAYGTPKKKRKQSNGNATGEEEDQFHRDLDKLVHKTFGHSSDEKKKKKQYSEEAQEAVAKHISEGVPFCDSIFRHGSDAYFETVNLAREQYQAGEFEADWESAEMFESDMGQQVKLKGVGTVYLDTPYVEEEEVHEAEYQGKDVDLNKPKRGGSKKFYVYVKNPKTGKVKKVSFGAAGGGGSLAVKLKDPKARKAFADRHNCDQKNDKTKAGYWSCRLPRYAKSLGLSGGGTWW